MARQISPSAQITTLAIFNHASGQIGATAARHPYRYFIAAGESLRLIEGAIQDAIDHPAKMRAFAAEFGADTIPTYGANYGRFFFNGTPATDNPAPVIKLAMPHKTFIADPQTPELFLPNPHAANSTRLYEKLDRLQNATGAEADELKESLLRETRAQDIVNGHFVFADADMRAEQIVFTPPPRLKSNPVFIMAGENPRGFTPDPSTPAGRDIMRRLNALTAQQFPLQRVMETLGVWEIHTNPHGHPRFGDGDKRPNDKYSGNCEKIGDEWIIAVPVVGTGRYGANGEGGSISGYQEDIAVPPGAVPISIADYFSRIEKLGALSFAGPNALPAPK